MQMCWCRVEFIGMARPTFLSCISIFWSYFDVWRKLVYLYLLDMILYLTFIISSDVPEGTF